MEAAVDRVLTCRPDHLVLGISAESIWGGGLEPSRRIAARVKARAGDLPLTQAADALHAAFKVLGIRQKVGLLTPIFQRPTSTSARSSENSGSMSCAPFIFPAQVRWKSATSAMQN